MLIHSASQVLTIPGGPQRGGDLGTLGIIENGAVLVHGEEIVAVAPTEELCLAYPNEPLLNAEGCAVLPGFIDAHTHLIWGGDRAAEFEQKIAGKRYLDILAAGGGILSTVRATREASIESLATQTRPRLQTMFAHGTTSAEAKSGYGLNTETEIKLLDGLKALNEEGPLEIFPTFLGAHAIPPEYKDNPQGYTDLICESMLSAVRDWWQKHSPILPLPFVDLFCEHQAFNLQQSRQILAKAKELGFPLKIHADEFENLGGAALAIELGAVSADHLVRTSAAEIEALGKSETVAVALPCTSFGLAEREYLPAQKIIAANGILALATDCNPGTAWCESMQLAIALACRYLKLTPAQAIAAATINAAQAIRAAERIGSIEPGKQADLLILSVSDYRHLGYRFGGNLVKQVIKRGQVYSVGSGYKWEDIPKRGKSHC